MSLGAKSFAVSFVVGLLGVFHAIEAAVLGLVRGDADVVLVVAAEEQTIVQRTAHELMAGRPRPESFPAPGVGTKQSARIPNRFYKLWRFKRRRIPEDRDLATRYEVRSEHRGPSLQSSTAFRAISNALLARQQRVVVTGFVQRLGCASVGLEAVEWM